MDGDPRVDGSGFSYTIDWFSGGIPIWQWLFSEMSEVAKVLEIGSYEGRSAVWLIENHVLKGTSTSHLAKLLAEGNAGSFDAIHVDGSQQCADVLSDLVLSFALLRTGGVMICDDYFWSLEERGREDLLNQPKLAIDSFVNCYRRKLSPKAINVRQIYLLKTAD
jgi:predicted O-methyltransferase YrrM